MPHVQIYVKAFESYRLTDIQTDTTKTIHQSTTMVMIVYLQRRVRHGGGVVRFHARSHRLIVAHVRRGVGGKAVERLGDWLVLVLHCHTHRLNVAPALIVRPV